jgi:hypothetical protein
MNVVSNVANIARSEGDPKVLETGPSSLTDADRLGRALGWFSLGLGLMEMFAPRTVTRMLGMEGHEGLVRAYGAREIGAGMLSLSTERSVGLWSRVAGDALDIATVATVAGGTERKRGAFRLALVALAGVAVLDLLAAQAVTAKHSRSAGSPRSYRDRSGYPQGLEAARSAARRRRAGDIRPQATSFKMTEHSAAG